MRPARDPRAATWSRVARSARLISAIGIAESESGFEASASKVDASWLIAKLERAIDSNQEGAVHGGRLPPRTQCIYQGALSKIGPVVASAVSTGSGSDATAVRRRPIGRSPVAYPFKSPDRLSVASNTNQSAAVCRPEVDRVVAVHESHGFDALSRLKPEKRPGIAGPRRRLPYFTGVRTGAPLFLIRNTTNFAGFVLLEFRPTVWTSSGPSWNVSPAWSVTSLPPFRPITMLPSST